MARSAQAGEALIARPFRVVGGSAGAVAILAAALCAFPAGAQGRVTLTGTNRSYSVGDSTVSENVANARLELFGPRIRFRLDGSALRFTAPTDSIKGNLPLSAHLSFARRPGDTVAVFARSSSIPLDLSTRQTSALSIAGASTIDLESSGFGTPAVGGTRATFAFPVGDAILAARGGFEYEPRPAGTQPVYWRGSTIRGGVALTNTLGEGSWTASLDVSRSTGDSLGGRNLFPGGGNASAQVILDASVLNPFDPLEDEQWPFRAVAFYVRPFGNDRADQPNLIIPQGDLFGAITTMLIPVNELSLAPSLQLLRESSRSSYTSGLLVNEVTGSSWTMQAGLDLSIPIGNVFELTPQLGYTFGTVSSASSQAAAVRRGRGIVRTSGFSDAIRGRWFSIQLSASM
ncbi:MAG: hypothetical protein V4550_08120 [Gemmatimonadota bacterium]